ncbi:sodium:proton antiporter [Halovenus sp. WSH3]|uniref:Sodium:proton antiporter n=1 Tax=Halovenus carboxidivorans TaxID=2692199 RepID=A0A6B0SXM1_9EURY|nr:sodium:proton antiporter [Halovenus carboxidivorans]
MTTVITRTTARIVVPIILVVAVSLFLQGHSLPGGGFIGGVLTVAAFTLVYVAYNLDYLEAGVLDREVDYDRHIGQHRTVAAYRRLFVFGLAVVVGSAVAGLFVGSPFLAQTYTYVHLPLFGEIELASAVVFDLGIYCVVVGGLLTIFSVVGAE